MADEAEPQEVPEGAAVFPLIPEELGVSPLLLAALHAVIFLVGSDDEVVQPDAAEEALHYLVTYLRRLDGPALRKVSEDLNVLAAFARQEQWPKEDRDFLRTFLTEFGIGTEENG
jgi:hypothetical protein